MGPGKQSEPAFRVAYEWEYGSLPEGLVPDHLCRYEPCVRPTHLEAVTSTTNQRRGSGTKLHAQDVLDIRERLAHGGITKAALAREYKVAYMTITFIERRVTWKDLL